jgi:hypothetical protein
MMVREAGESAALEQIKAQRDQFKTMYAIIQDLKVPFVLVYSNPNKAQNLESAIKWSQEHKRQGLEFHLHRVAFTMLLLSSPLTIPAALAYSKAHLSKFGKTHHAQISRLMCAILYAGRLPTSPYADLASASVWPDVIAAFTRDFAACLGHSPDSPLYVANTMGALALPTIIKMSSVMARGGGIEWTSTGELPVEIPLTDAQRFHSVFAWYTFFPSFKVRFQRNKERQRTRQ